MTSQSVSIQLRRQVVETAGRMKHSEHKNDLSLIRNPQIPLSWDMTLFQGGSSDSKRFEGTYAFFLKGQWKPEVQYSLSL